MVDLYAECLEEACHVFLLLLAAEERINDLQKVLRGEDRLLRARLHDGGCYLP